MDDQRGHNEGRRFDDDRWLKVQKEIMGLVTSVRSAQQSQAKLEVQFGKLEDHVDDVDDHLRGVAGHDSMDTRVAVLERSNTANNVLLREIKRKLDDQKSIIDEIRSDLASIKIHRSISKEYDSSKMERFKEWMKLWGAMSLASIALIVPLATLAFQNWDKVERMWKKPDPDPVHKMIDRAKHPRTTRVRVRVVPAKTPAKEPIESTAPVSPVPELNEGGAR